MGRVLVVTLRSSLTWGPLGAPEPNSCTEESINLESNRLRMSQPIEQHFRVSWGDVDGNGHMANIAYLTRSADTRFLFFFEHGFPNSRFAAEHIGPVILRDELVYRKELRLLQEFTVDLQMVGLSPDGGRFRIQNTFRNSAGEVTAIVTSEGLWFDLVNRRPRAPPPDLDLAQRAFPRGDPFVELPGGPQ